MRTKLYLMIGFLSFVALADGSLKSKRLDAERLVRDRRYNEACAAFMALASDSANKTSRAAYDCRKALFLLRKVQRINELDELRGKLSEVHFENFHVLEVLAMDYATDPHHWGYTLNGRFFRGPVRYGNAQAVTCVARDRARAIGLMVKAANICRESSKKDYARLCLKAAALILYRDDIRLFEDLDGLTDLEALPAFEIGHDDRYRIEGGDDGAYALEQLSLPTLPMSWDASRTDGERWRFLLGEAGKNGLKRDADIEWADYLRNILGVKQLRYILYVSPMTLTKACNQLTDDQTLTVVGGMVAKLTLTEETNYLSIYREHKATERLAGVYRDRGQLTKLATLDPVPQSLLSAVDTYSFDRQSPRPKEMTTVAVSYTRPITVSVSAQEINFKAIWADAIAYLRSNPAHFSKNRLSLSGLGERARKNKVSFLMETGDPSHVVLPPVGNGTVGVVDVSSVMSGNGLYLLEGRTTSGVEFDAVRHVTNMGIIRKPLVSGAWFQVVTLTNGTPLPNVDLNFLGYRTSYGDGGFSLQHAMMTKRTDSNGQVILTEKELVGKDGEPYKWAVYAESQQGFAYMDFTALPVSSPLDAPANDWHAHLTTDCLSYQPGDTLRYRGRVIHAGYAGPEATAPKDKAFALFINDPRKKRAFTIKHKVDDAGSFEGRYPIPANAIEGRYYIYVPEANATIPFDVVSAEALVPKVTLRSSGRIAPGETGSCQLTVEYPRPIVGTLSAQMRVQLELDGKIYPLSTKTISPIRSSRSNAFHWERSLSWDTETLFDLLPKSSGSIRIEATVSLDGKAISRWATLAIHDNPGKVHVTLDRSFHDVGSVVHANFFASNHYGVGLKGDGIAIVSRLTSSGKKRETSRIPFRTDASGAGAITVPELRSGTFELKVALLPETPGLCFKIPMLFGGGFHVPARNFRYKHGAYSSRECVHGKADLIIHRAGVVDDPFIRDPLTLIPETTVARPGGTVRVLALLKRPAAHMALFMRPALSYHPPKYIEIKRHTALIDVVVDERDAPNLFMEGVIASAAIIRSDIAEIHIRRSSSIIDLTLEGPSEAAPSAAVSIPVVASLPKGTTTVHAMAWVVEADELLTSPMSLDRQIRPWSRSHQTTTSSSFTGSAPDDRSNPQLLKYLTNRERPLETGSEVTMEVEASSKVVLVPSAQLPRTIYWGPVSLTADGRGKLVFDMPASSRDVRVFVWCLGDAGALGSLDKTIVNRSMVSMDLVVPGYLQVGDVAKGRVTLKNLKRGRQSLGLQLTSSSGLLLEDADKRRVKILDRQSQDTAFTVKAVSAGTAKVSAAVESKVGKMNVGRRVQVLDLETTVKAYTHQTVLLTDAGWKAPPSMVSDQYIWAHGLGGVLELASSRESKRHLLPFEALNRVLATAHFMGTRRNKETTLQSKDDAPWNALRRRNDEVMLRLSESQCRDGGWNWLGIGDGVGDPLVTASIVHGLQTVRRRGLQIQRSVLYGGIRFLRGYLDEQEIRLKGERADRFTPKEFSDDTDAQVYQVLIESRDTPNGILDFLIRDFERLSLVSQCRVVLALRTQRYYEKIAPLMARLYKKCGASKDESRRWLGDSSVAGTAEFLLAMNMASPGDPELMPYLDWLIDQRTAPGSWGGNRLDARCLEAMAAYCRGREKAMSLLTLAVGEGKTAMTLATVGPDTTGTVSGMLTVKKSDGLIRATGSGRLYLSTPVPKPVASDLEVGMELEMRKDAVLSVGEAVTCQLAVTLPKAVDRLLVRFPLPGGLRPFVAGDRLAGVAPFDQGSVHDGWIYLYAERLPQGRVDLAIKLEAAIAGAFGVSPPEVYIDGVRTGCGGASRPRTIQIK